MLSRRVEFIVLIFDIFGFNSGYTAFSRNNKISFIIFLFHFVIVMSLTIGFYFLTIKLKYFYDVMTLINQLIQYTSGLNAYWLVIFDSIQNRKHHQEFWKIFIKIDEYFSAQNIQLQYFLVRFIEYFTVSILLVCLNCLTEAFSNSYIMFMFMTLIFASELRVFYYVFCMNILLHQLKTIENELQVMNKSSRKCFYHMNNETSSFHAPYERTRFKWVREYFYCVNEMSLHLNKLFGWSQLSGIFYCFYTLVTVMMWLYSGFFDKSTVKIISKIYQ